jgi:hypothetical protein
MRSMATPEVNRDDEHRHCNINVSNTIVYLCAALKVVLKLCDHADDSD